MRLEKKWLADNADKAIAIACEKKIRLWYATILQNRFFCESNNSPWMADRIWQMNPENITAFTYELDNALKELNSDYEVNGIKILPFAYAAGYIVCQRAYLMNG